MRLIFSQEFSGETMRLGMILERIRRLIGRGRSGTGSGEVCSLLIDPFAEDYGEEAERGGAIAAEAVRAACRRMQGAKTKGSLLRAIADEMAAFDLHDLETMNTRFEHKVGHLPEDYRDRLLSSVREEIFSAHHRLLLLSRNGGGRERDDPPAPALGAYCSMVAEACTEKAREKDPKHLYLKYLLSAFTIFVMEEGARSPGRHPVPGQTDRRRVGGSLPLPGQGYGRRRTLRPLPLLPRDPEHRADLPGDAGPPPGAEATGVPREQLDEL